MTEATNKQRQEQAVFNLTQTLKDLGSNKKEFNAVQSCYDRLLGDKRFTADRKDWLKIGEFIQKCKDNTKGKNANSGAFGSLVIKHFPRLTAQLISTARWYYNHHELIDKVIKENKLTVSNPEAIKKAIRKHLVDSEAGKDDFEKFGLKQPKAKAGGKTVKKSADKSDDNQVEEFIKNSTMDSLLKGLESMRDTVQHYAKHKRSHFDQQAIDRLDKVATDIADVLDSFVETPVKTGTDG